MDFDAFINTAWTDHATDPAAVADRILGQALALVTEENRVVPMAHLAQHVFGDHLARWSEGLAFLDQVTALPVTQGAAAQAVARFQAALKLAGGLADTRAALDTSERIRVTALAAAQLGAHDATRSLALLDEGAAAAEHAALPDKDLAHRNLAIAGNGIASTLEEMPSRSEAQAQLMLRAAQVARRFWALAGTWVETERADYRLALSHLQAGLLPQARQHAQDCLEIVRAHGSVPLEAFFAWEALGRVERAAGNATGHAQAVAQAEAAFLGLAAGDKGWCQASLDGLKAAAAR
jgi:hypothetical protein